MNKLDLKIIFYKNKIENSKEKIAILKENIKINKIKILNFITTIDDKKDQEIILNKINSKINTYENTESILISYVNDDDYYSIKNEYKKLKYNKNVLKDNWFLYWCDTLNYEEKINFILQI
jgi:hypothetical protein